jgi:hypothetical protein
MSPSAISRSRIRSPLVSFVLCAALFAVLAPPARAEFGLLAFDGEVTANAAGDPFTQAGGHPFAASTTFVLNNTDGIPDGDMKTVEAQLPPGFVGDPMAMPRCASVERLLGNRCPDASQVGLAQIDFSPVLGDPRPAPIYNLVPPPGVPARFGFTTQALVVLFDASIRSEGDYGVNVTVRDISQVIPVVASSVTFWGVPADPSHDAERGFNEDRTNPCADVEIDCSNPAGVDRKPFLTLPTACTAPGVGLRTTLRTDSWQNPGSFEEASFDSHLPPGHPEPPENWGPEQGPTGCEQVPFDPSIRVQPTNTQPDSPTGLEVELAVPVNENPDGISQSHLRKAVVTMPEGMTVNPSSADGLAACSPAQIGLDNRDDPTCPEASKIGSVEVDTPLLEETMLGSVYVAKQADNPFRSLLAIYIVAEGPGVIVKLAGKVDPDPVTGQLTTTFDNNPQLPFSSFRLRFKDGPRAPLATPPTCGTKTVTTELTPWSGNAPASPSDSFTIACPGISGFAPSFDAGTTNPAAGAFSPFAMRINRSDGQQYMRGLSFEMPPGLIANLRDVPLCPDAQANAGTCDLASKIGTVVVGAGAGSQPFFTAPEHGSVYLTEGYKGAPFGLSTVVRAIAGPYDLGTVIVRQSIFVDPTDAHITVISDPIPTILEGIPLRIRSINVDVNRPGFVINPTSCGEKQIKATMVSIEGTVHQAVQRLQVGDCQALPLKPKFTMRMTGRRQTGEGRHPGLRTVLTQGDGQANMKRVVVKLPLSLALDPENAQSDALCEFEAGQRVDCPPSSIIGDAVAFTPVLKQPLRGPVYFVKNIRIHPVTGRQIRTLPTLLITLRGEVAINVRATSDVIDEKLVSTFHTVPDAPVSRFVLTLNGGAKGILVATRNICRRPRSHITDMEIDGHNGKRADQAVRMRTPCAKKRKKRAALKVRKATWEGRHLEVAGRIAAAATKRVKVTARCGGSSVSERVKPTRGRWQATIALGGRCATARNARLVVSYPGGPKVRHATASRRVSRGT